MSTIDDLRAAHDAELGRIFHELLETLAAIERRYLDAPDRSEEDLQALALECLDAISLALLKAKRSGQSSIEGYNMPWPLLIVTQGLHDVFKGRYSDVLTPITQGRHRPKGAPAHNRLKAKQIAAARETLAWLEKTGWPLSKAASEIVAIFQEQNIRANGKDAITTATVLEWRKQSNKKTKTEAELILEERSEYRKALDDLDNVKRFTLTLDGVFGRQTLEEVILTPDFECDVYRSEEHEFSIPVSSYRFTDDDRASVILAQLRKFIAATSYRQ